MTCIMMLLFAGLGGWLSRMCGGAPPSLPFGMVQWIYALPYLFITFMSSSFAFIVYLIAVLGKRTGHGGGIDLGHSSEEPKQGRKVEKLEYLVLWLNGKLSKYWYDASILALTGLLVTVPAGILIAFTHPFWGVFIALSGASKPIAYMIGWAIYPNSNGKGWKWLNEATAIGEFLTGFLSYAAIGLTYLAIGL